MRKKIAKMLCVVFVFCIGLMLGNKKAAAAENYGLSAADAGMITFGTEYTGSLSDAEKEHWYTFTTKDSDDYYYAMSLNKLKMKGNFILVLLDASGKRVESVSVGDNEEQVRLTPATTYYLRGYSPSGIDADHMYCFTLDTIDDPETDSMADVTIELSHKKAYNGTVAKEYDEDWFVFCAKANESTINASKKDDGWGLIVKVYDKNGVYIKSTTVGAGYSGSIAFETVKDEMYYVCVSTNSSFDYGEEKDDSYSITLISGSDEVENLKKPTSLYPGTKVIVGEALPNATVKCVYGKKGYTVKANSKGIYTVKLKQRLKKNTKVVLWQLVDGTASKKLSVKVSASGKYAKAAKKSATTK